MYRTEHVSIPNAKVGLNELRFTRFHGTTFTHSRVYKNIDITRYNKRKHTRGVHALYNQIHDDRAHTSKSMLNDPTYLHMIRYRKSIW